MYTDICYSQPRNLEERILLAKEYVVIPGNYPFLLLVDDVSDQASQIYSAWPGKAAILSIYLSIHLAIQSTN